jgi:hypothetical protein
MHHLQNDCKYKIISQLLVTLQANLPLEDISQSRAIVPPSGVIESCLFIHSTPHHSHVPSLDQPGKYWSKSSYTRQTILANIYTEISDHIQHGQLHEKGSKFSARLQTPRSIISCNRWCTICSHTGHIWQEVVNHWNGESKSVDVDYLAMVLHNIWSIAPDTFIN